MSRARGRIGFIGRGMLLGSLLGSGVSCVTVNADRAITLLERSGSEPVHLPDAEHMIDELDRIMTANGTISVKTPDVWGQDRLAKFRSEYEAQMASWLKLNFKGEINAAVRHAESEATHVSLGGNVDQNLPKGSNTNTNSSTTMAFETNETNIISRSQSGLNGSPVGVNGQPDKNAPALEPTVVLDEHSNYLNHLNQLRRINAGDDLADRPGYGLYLVRIPVTLAPGPRSRSGKGAIITVSAKSIMSKHTVRDALRNAVINETVTNLTDAIVNRSGRERDQNPEASAGSFSLLSFADTELYHGAENIALLKSEVERHLANEISDEPHHGTARIAEWLRNELLSHYHLFEATASPTHTPNLAASIDPLEEIGESIVKRDFTRIASVRPAVRRHESQILQTSTASASTRNLALDQRASVVNILTFSLRIQAAGLNRRLKQDIADQLPDLTPEDLRHVSFFEPEPTDHALEVFQKYVESKWPLRVYAIEPVIAQQNVADALSRRKFSALDLVGSAYTGPLKALAGFDAQRQAAEDESAIRLNPTMVGFGAGQSTFGWIFYPRLQTGSTRRRLLTDFALLATGRVPDPTGNDQSIEPGQRECTALVEMPNFVPKIEFVTVANWFRTSEVGDGQKSDLEKAAVLGRKLVLAEETLTRSRVEGHYRPEEYQIASERLNQLRSLMPTQRLVVRVPFTDTQNDGRMFCSHGSQLRPALTGWHGRPPDEGDESTFFLEGKNFSVHDTHVIAGGKPATSVLVSRHLLKVTIPKDACTSPSANGSNLLEVSVATPNGVSNHLLIKSRPKDGSRRTHDNEVKLMAAKDEKAGGSSSSAGTRPGTIAR